MLWHNGKRAGAHRRIVITMAFLAALLPTTGLAQECGKLQLLNTVQLIPSLSGALDLVPVEFQDNQKTKFLLLDTGGLRSQLTMDAAKDLQLQTFAADFQVSDLTGIHKSSQLAKVDSFSVGRAHVADMNFMIAPLPIADGVFAMDLLGLYDADLDFGSDTLNYFSEDHCPGAGQYWAAPIVAVLPMSVDSDHHVSIPVELDGNRLNAYVDTGATETLIRADLASTNFGLTLGDGDTPTAGTLNGAGQIYAHTFKELTFGGVAIDTPQFFFYGPNIEPTQPLSGTSAGPEMIIGMDVLRKLHLYFAFGENKLYISQASQPEPANIAPFSAEYLAFQLSAFDQLLLAHPENADGLQARCFWRAVAKTDLDSAMADCNQALVLKPGDAASYYSRAFVLYQQGKYQEALGDVNSALAANPNISDAFFLRGMIKGQLGDQNGKDADITAAKAMMPRVEINFRRLGISD